MRPRGQQPPATAPAQGDARGREHPERLLRRLHWTVLRPLASRWGGIERTRLHGPGIELSEVREYQPGDDPRMIDWNLTARANQPFVRLAPGERALDVWLLVDLSASVDWGTARCLKRERAVELAAVVAELLGRQGNRLGLLFFAEQPLGLLPVGNGRRHRLRLVDLLQREAQQQRHGRTDLRAALLRLRPFLRRPALIVIISDFLVEDGWQAPLRQLAQRHETIAARLIDPREMALPAAGWLALEDPETGEHMVINSGDQRLRAAFAAAAQAQREQLRTTLLRCGAAYLEVSTEHELVPQLLPFLATRRRHPRAPTPHHMPAVATGLRDGGGDR